jgi:hypothetical protein
VRGNDAHQKSDLVDVRQPVVQGGDGSPTRISRAYNNKPREPLSSTHVTDAVYNHKYSQPSGISDLEPMDSTSDIITSYQRFEEFYSMTILQEVN